MLSTWAGDIRPLIIPLRLRGWRGCGRWSCSTTTPVTATRCSIACSPRPATPGRSPSNSSPAWKACNSKFEQRRVVRFVPLVPGRLVSWLSHDGHLILAARAVRTFAYGYLSVILGVYLEGLGLAPWQIGAVLTVTLAGSAALTVIFSVIADTVGRRRMLFISAVLMAAAGGAFAVTSNYLLLLLASLTGTIGATSGEVGPFLSLEQAILPQTTDAQHRTALFGVYNTAGALGGAAGVLFFPGPPGRGTLAGTSPGGGPAGVVALFTPGGVLGFCLVSQLR